MAERQARCDVCRAVVDASSGECPLCGSALRPVEPVVVETGSYADRYRGTAYDPPPIAPAGPPAARRATPPAALLIAGGGLLLFAAVVFGAAMLLGSTSPQQPVYVVPFSPTPSPSPTLPPSVAATIAELNDPSFSAKIVVDSRLSLDGRLNNGHAMTASAHLDAAVSGGDETGTLRADGTVTEFRTVGGTFYARTGSGKWQAGVALATHLQLLPLFELTDPAMIALVGAETRDGIAVNHVRTTSRWQADPSRLAVLDLSAMPVRPERTSLDLWLALDGRPVAATFTAATDTSDGSRHLLFVQSTYTFSEVGVALPIAAPSLK